MHNLRNDGEAQASDFRNKAARAGAMSRSEAPGAECRHVFAAASCNRQPGTLSTLPSHSLAAYAAYNNVFVLSTDTNAVISVHAQDKSPINALKLIHHKRVRFIIADSDGNIKETILEEPWRPSSFQAHSASCVAFDVVSTPDDRLILVTVGEDQCIKVWKLEDEYNLTDVETPRGRVYAWADEWFEICSCQIANTRRIFERQVLPECIAAFPISAETTLIALGGTDPAVQLYLHNGKDVSFVASLRGHRDWIRGLAFHQAEDAILLATASTDSTARIWKITDTADETATLTLPVEDKTLSFTKYALLDEHTKAVHTVSFCDGHLLTASMDCSVAVWIPSDQSTCVARFGLMGGASAHALGFFGAQFASSDASHILAHNFSGALHRWQLVEQSSTSYQYVAHAAPTGHFAPVSEIAWSPGGEFLLSCSVDKTTRIFAEVRGRFVEWARPQVHGHSLFTVAFCDESGRRYVSGAEERMLRLFEAPTSFQLPGVKGQSSGDKQPLGASMPQLGLSNKPIFAEEGGEDVPKLLDPVSSFGVGRAKSLVPLEEDLNQYRLWPETAKLYGHGNEISCVTVDIKNGVLASACRAQTETDAVIILWDVSNGAECGRLHAHELTVNQMCFTEDGTALLSASKDRSFAVCRKVDSRFNFHVAIRRQMAHKRLLYCCAWIKDNKIIATGSRDKSLKLFAVDENADEESGTELKKYKFDAAVTAMDCLKRLFRTLLAVGFENGDIRLFAVNYDDTSASMRQLLKCEDYQMRCGLRVTSLQWRPCDLWQDSELQLGIASEDCSVRVYFIRIPR